MESIAARAKAASQRLAVLPTPAKNAVLRDIAQRIRASAATIKQATDADLAAAKLAGLGDAKLKRLALTDAAIAQMAEGVAAVSALPDPVGQITRQYRVPSGLDIKRVRCPLGVILMIYEARPNVTIDAFALCFKSGNACILKGGREAGRTNEALGDIVAASLAAQGAPTEAITLITSSDREEMKELLRQTQHIDLVIPRGGTELIRFVHEHSRIPMVQHFMGVCHIFVDASADLDRAVEICATAKTSSPAACNAVETLLIHEQVAPAFVPRLAERFQRDGVELRGDAAVCALAPSAKAATEEDWGREYLDLIVAVKVVPNVDAAIAHIRRYGSNHTEAILSGDAANQQRFVSELQSSCVLVNASTRFNDGFQLGLGAEIGISTSKIHAYGPMGLEELTTQRWVVLGSGQAR